MKFLKSLILLFFIGSLLFSQERNCGTMQYLEYKKSKDSNLEQRMLENENLIQNWITNQPESSNNSIITIPVVVHVVYYNSTENISVAQIQSQIDVLNEDFRRLNSDAINTPIPFQAIAADCQIEFCLATTDPNGNPTNGITRTQTNQSSFSTNDNVKFTSSGGIDAWNTSNYLNMWVCDISGGILGYAQFPGGASSTDGVVVDYAYFGNTGTATFPFSLGRTATHEVGHYLNLRHIWGDSNCGNDYCNDTPVHSSSNSGCPSFPSPSNCSGNGSHGDMFMNYMDYTNDGCMNLFTQDQKTRMLASLNTFRSGLINSNGCSNNSFGCTDPNAVNYDPNASTDDGSCCFVSGCTDPGAINYNQNACFDDGSCVASILGCNNSIATNFDPIANTNIAFGGPIDNTFGTGGYFTGNQHLVFDANKQCVIKSAIVYAQAANTITFELRDNLGTIIEDTTLTVVAGQQRITLDFNTPIGNDMQLGISSANSGLFRNNSNVNYPYNIASAINIKSSSASSDPYGYYYFFYDLEVEAICTGITTNISGCTDPLAQNYNSNATLDDGSCIYCTTTLPYTENFDLGNFGSWTNTGSAGNWILNQFSTPSNNTGPSDDITGGGSYVYVEASSPNYPYVGPFTLTSECFDISSSSNPTLTFSYNMYGTNVGTLNLYANNILIWTLSGDQGQGWNSVQLGLPLSSTLVLDFEVITGASWNGDIAIDNIGIVQQLINGCTDPLALNYNINATIDDGSCCYISGCTDPLASNYNSYACSNDGSCCYFSGCTDPSALNYDPNACFDNSSCCYISGCTDPNALNYDPNACFDNSSCCYISGCTDPIALNYNPNACFDDGSCQFPCNTFSLPFYEDFENMNNFPPSNWTVLNNDNSYTWNLSNIGFNSNKSMFIENSNYSANGQIDDVILPAFDFSVSNNITLTFDLAYTLWTPLISTSWSDTLQILISQDCGITFNKIWQKSGQDLVTSSISNNSFSWYPSSLNDWRNESIDLSSYIGNSDIIIAFRNINDYENNLFIDNISISSYNLGCTDQLACNFDSLANIDDGSCTYSSTSVTDTTVCDTFIWNGVVYTSSTVVSYLTTNTSGCDSVATLNLTINNCTPVVCAEDAPTNLSATNVIQNRATINWDNMNSSVCLVDQYRIKFRPVGSSTWTQKTMGQPVGSCLWACNKVEKLILNLIPNTTYEYQMKAWYCGGGASAWTSLHTFTTAPECPNVGNLAVTTPTPTKATFTWDDSNGTYSFTRIKSRVDIVGSTWFNVGGTGVAHGTFTKNKNGLTPGESYRGQARTWCDPNGGAYKSPSWTSLIYWTMPTVRMEVGATISNLDVYPNPSRDMFNVTFTSEDVQDLEVRVINIIGEEIIKEDLQQFVGEYVKVIDLNNYDKGIYLLEITTNNGVINKKLILN